MSLFKKVFEWLSIKRQSGMTENKLGGGLGRREGIEQGGEGGGMGECGTDTARDFVDEFVCA